MEYSGGRIFSTKEIKEMLGNALSDDFLKYYEIAPESIKKIILQWAHNKNSIKNYEILLEVSKLTFKNDRNNLHNE